MNDHSKPSDWDNSTARAEILKRIRTLQGRAGHPSPLEQKQVELSVGRHQRGPQPLAVDDVVAVFEQRTLDMLSTLERVDNQVLAMKATVQLINRLREEGVIQAGAAVSIWPSLAELPWPELPHPLVGGTPAGNELVGVSEVAYAVAETGTLVFASRADQPARTHLLPETHIAWVRASQVVHTMEDALDAIRHNRGGLPRVVNFVSGPSRTADIEQTIVLGAHGPYRVHVVLIEDRG